MMCTRHREPRNGNRAEPSAHRFLAESSDKRPSAQYLRPNLQPIYQITKLLKLPVQELEKFSISYIVAHTGTSRSVYYDPFLSSLSLKLLYLVCLHGLISWLICEDCYSCCCSLLLVMDR